MAWTAVPGVSEVIFNGVKAAIHASRLYQLTGGTGLQKRLSLDQPEAPRSSCHNDHLVFERELGDARRRRHCGIGFVMWVGYSQRHGLLSLASLYFVQCSKAGSANFKGIAQGISVLRFVMRMVKTSKMEGELNWGYPSSYGNLGRLISVPTQYSYATIDAFHGVFRSKGSEKLHP